MKDLKKVKNIYYLPTEIDQKIICYLSYNCHNNIFNILNYYEGIEKPIPIKFVKRMNNAIKNKKFNFCENVMICTLCTKIRYHSCEKYENRGFCCNHYYAICRTCQRNCYLCDVKLCKKCIKKCFNCEKKVCEECNSYGTLQYTLCKNCSYKIFK